MNRSADAWCVRETSLPRSDAGTVASLLTLSNGYVGVRGVLDEGRPAAGPATLMASVHDERPFTYAEPAYGYPETDEHPVPLPDGWALDVVVGGHPLDTGTGRLDRHERTLDLRAGALDRDLRWTSPAGSTVELTARRMVSFTRRELVTTAVELRAVDAVRVELRPFRCEPARADPDTPAGPADALARRACRHDVDHAWSLHEVPSTGIGVLVAADWAVDADDGAATDVRTGPHGTRVLVDLGAGQAVRLLLHAAYTAGPGAAQVDLHTAARTVLDDARAAGWDALQAEQRAFLDDVWSRADVEVDGDPVLQTAVRFAVLQVVQAAARTEGVGIRAKGLTGTGYHGHTFWDADTFVLPVLNHALPTAAAHHLRWRHTTLPQAVRRAAELGLAGAAFPWRTITGRECSGYWPAGTAAHHITADVADAAVRHGVATGDATFVAEVAVDLVVHAARLWLSLGHHARDGFRIDGVTGPDEYSALADNNTYTNLMARRNLRAADELAARFPHRAHRLGVTADERAAWCAAADAMVMPVDDELGVTQQSEGFTRHAAWDFAATGPDDYPLDSHAPYGALYRRQVVKQADLVVAHHLAGDAFDLDRKRRDFAYYEPLTVRDSSLSAPSQAVVAAEVGHADLALAYVRETALIDLRDLDGTTHEGLHVAALAGAWTALVAGFGGLRDHDGGLHLRPTLPPALAGLRFRLLRHDALVEVRIARSGVTYRLVRGSGVDLTHDGQPVRLTPAEPVADLPLVVVPQVPAPPQPPGRGPRGAG